MRPTSDTALQRPDLGIAVFETLQQAAVMGFIGMQVMPMFSVPVTSAEYPVIPKEALFNLLETKRGSKGTYNQDEDEFESGFFKTSENGLEKRVDDRFAAIYGTQFAYELTIANILMGNILRAWEYRVASKLFNTSNFSATNATTSWATHASADPQKDVETGKTSLRGNGIVPNALILNWTAFTNCRQCADVQEKVYQLFPDAAKTGRITIEHLRTYFDVERILVAGALYNTANRNQNASLSDIWGTQYAMLCKIADGDVTEPCIGRTFHWDESGQAGPPVIVEEYYDNKRRSNILRVRHDTDEAFLASYDEDKAAKSEISKACGYLLDPTAAS